MVIDLAEVLGRQRRAGQAVAGVGTIQVGRHALAIDVEILAAHHDVVARQADQPLDVVGGRILRQAEHDHVAPLRIADRDDLGIDHRQPQARRRTC